MDEIGWANERADAQGMVHQLRELGVPRTKIGRRKLRLFACEIVRAWRHTSVDEVIFQNVLIAERFADQMVSRAVLFNALQSGLDEHSRRWDPHVRGEYRFLAVQTCHPEAFQTALLITASPFPILSTRYASDGWFVSCNLLRCVFGNPFQKPAFNKKWRSESVTALATGIYEERAFDRLPILADALEEAGCDEPTMLSHLRGSGPHCRGCWVLDLALGK